MAWQFQTLSLDQFVQRWLHTNFLADKTADGSYKPGYWKKEKKEAKNSDIMNNKISKILLGVEARYIT